MSELRNDDKRDEAIETPRSDAAEVYYSEIVTGRDGGLYWVRADLARHLERELAEVRRNGAHYAAKYEELLKSLPARDQDVRNAALSAIERRYGFEKAQAVCILLCRDALIRKDYESAYHWLYTLDSKQTPHDPFKPWEDLEALAGDAYKPEEDAPASAPSSIGAPLPEDIEHRIVEMIRYIGVKAGVKDTVYGAMCHEVRCILRNAHLDYEAQPSATRAAIDEELKRLRVECGELALKLAGAQCFIEEQRKAGKLAEGEGA